MESIIIDFIVENWEPIIAAGGGLLLRYSGKIFTKVVDIYNSSDLRKKKKVYKIIKYLNSKMSETDEQEVLEMLWGALNQNTITPKDIHNRKMILKKYLKTEISKDDKCFFENIMYIAQNKSTLDNYLKNKKTMNKLVNLINNVRNTVDDSSLLDFLLNLIYLKSNKDVENIVENIVEKIKEFLNSNDNFNNSTIEKRKQYITNFIIDNIPDDRFNLKQIVLRELNCVVQKQIISQTPSLSQSSLSLTRSSLSIDLNEQKEEQIFLSKKERRKKRRAERQ